MRVTADTKSATQRRILDAARELFAREGFETATTRDIARMADIAVGTLFNYFPTKESIAMQLVSEAHAGATEEFFRRAAERNGETTSLEELLFLYVATGLRKLKPYRKYLPAILETLLSPLATGRGEEHGSLRANHLETVAQIAGRHRQGSPSPLALQIYWTLYVGVLAHWARDASPKQEDTLALLDQSLAMFAGWLAAQPDDSNDQDDSTT